MEETGMSLILEQGFSIKRGKEEAFQHWLSETDELTKKSAPEGVEYLGTYVVWFGSDRTGGEYRSLWRLDSFAAFDRMEEAARDAENDWGRIKSRGHRVHGPADRLRGQLRGLQAGW